MIPSGARRRGRSEDETVPALGQRGRQSLAPIVWNGQPNLQLNDNPDRPQWGYTLGGLTRVWRSGVGIDRRGNLIYAAVDGQTVITLAKILQNAGAVRAMEFDINPEWRTLITYTHGANGLVPTMVGPNPMLRPILTRRLRRHPGLHRLPSRDLAADLVERSAICPRRSAAAPT